MPADQDAQSSVAQRDNSRNERVVVENEIKDRDWFKLQRLSLKLLEFGLVNHEIHRLAVTERQNSPVPRSGGPGCKQGGLAALISLGLLIPIP